MLVEARRSSNIFSNVIPSISQSLFLFTRDETDPPDRPLAKSFDFDLEIRNRMNNLAYQKMDTPLKTSMGIFMIITLELASDE